MTKNMFDKLAQLTFLDASFNESSLIQERKISDDEKCRELLISMSDAISVGLTKAKKNKSFDIRFRIDRPKPISKFQYWKMARKAWKKLPEINRKSEVEYENKIFSYIIAWFITIICLALFSIFYLHTSALGVFLTLLIYSLIFKLNFTIQTVFHMHNKDYVLWSIEPEVLVGDDTPFVDVVLKESILETPKKGYIWSKRTRKSEITSVRPKWLTPELLQAHIEKYIDQQEQLITPKLPHDVWIQMIEDFTKKP